MIPKFRAWDTEQKKIWSVFEVTFHPDTFEPISVRVGYAENGSMVTKRLYNYPNKDPGFILEQYIGRIDKNSKEIYQGNLIKSRFGNVYEVVLDKYGYHFKSTTETVRRERCGCCIDTEAWEVIGNIHEGLK